MVAHVALPALAEYLLVFWALTSPASRKRALVPKLFHAENSVDPPS